MKVGILTYHWIYNFGGQLQALATSEVLKNLGYEPIVLDLIQPDVRSDFYEKHVPVVQQQAHIDFSKKYLPVTHELNNEQDLINIVDSLDLKHILVGSDAVFFIKYPHSPLSDTRYPSLFWMKWIEKCKNYPNIKIFSISASCMETNFMQLPSNVRKGLNDSLKNFNKVTIRDIWTKLFIKRVSFFKPTTISPDPVMSFNDNVRKEFTDPIQVPINGKYILYGLQTGVGHNKHQVLAQLKEKFNKLGYQFVALPFPEGSYNLLDDVSIPNPVNPLLWYKLIANASGIISEKFHPIVVSIHNKVPFVAIDSYGDRVSKKFLIPVHMRILSKTFDVCRRNGFKQAHLPTSRLTLSKVDYIVDLLCNREWDFSKSQTRPMEFKKIIESFGIAKS